MDTSSKYITTPASALLALKLRVTVASDAGAAKVSDSRYHVLSVLDSILKGVLR